MTHCDLFSGIGGFAIGAEAAGLETVAFCEQDVFCQAVLRREWPGVPIHDDVRTLQSADIGGSVDLLTAGFPCQKFSLASKGEGLDEDGLFFQVKRIAGALRPRYVILENVPGLFVRGFGRVLGALAEIGYDAEWTVIPACRVGAPHLRERVWIVAYADGSRLEERSGKPSNSRQKQSASKRNGQALGNGNGVRRPQLQGLFAESGRRTVDAGEALGDDVSNGRSQGRTERPLRAWGFQADVERAPLLSRLPFWLDYVRDRPDNPWRRAVCVRGYDGTIRAVDASIPLLAHGIPQRIHKLRATGNSIVPPIAEAIALTIREAVRRFGEEGRSA